MIKTSSYELTSSKTTSELTFETVSYIPTQYHTQKIRSTTENIMKNISETSVPELTTLSQTKTSSNPETSSYNNKIKSNPSSDKTALKSLNYGPKIIGISFSLVISFMFISYIYHQYKNIPDIVPASKTNSEIDDDFWSFDSTPPETIPEIYENICFGNTPTDTDPDYEGIYETIEMQTLTTVSESATRIECQAEIHLPPDDTLVESFEMKTPEENKIEIEETTI